MIKSIRSILDIVIISLEIFRWLWIFLKVIIELDIKNVFIIRRISVKIIFIMIMIVEQRQYLNGLLLLSLVLMLWSVRRIRINLMNEIKFEKVIIGYVLIVLLFKFFSRVRIELRRLSVFLVFKLMGIILLVLI